MSWSFSCEVMQGGCIAGAMTYIRNIANCAKIWFTLTCFWIAALFENVDGDDRFPPLFAPVHKNALQGLHVQFGFEAHKNSVDSNTHKTNNNKKTSMNIIKGEVKGPVLNNAHVTYFCYTADSISFIQAGKDPAVLGLSTLHLSLSIFNCFLLLCECLFHVRCSISYEARWRSSIILLTHVKLSLSTYINKAHNLNFYEAFLCQMNLIFPCFPPGPHCCPVWTMSVLC